jgi:hypothetical protein
MIESVGLHIFSNNEVRHSVMKNRVLQVNPYKKGTALNDAVQERKKVGSTHADGFEERYAKVLQRVRPDSKIEGEEDVCTFRLWGGFLAKHCKDLDAELDELTNRVMACKDSWFRKKTPVLEVLNSLLEGRSTMRDLEAEVEEFVLCLITIPSILNELSDPVIQMLNEVHKTYERTFDLCVLKLSTINAGRITATNIMLSISALAIAVWSLIVAMRASLPRP